ncbi:MAG: hypothetical protein ACRDAW_01315 [Metamycoplasmataceae bacterium]
MNNNKKNISEIIESKSSKGYDIKIYSTEGSVMVIPYKNIYNEYGFINDGVGKVKAIKILEIKNNIIEFKDALIDGYPSNLFEEYFEEVLICKLAFNNLK